MKVQISIIIIKKILNYLQIWDLRCLECQFLGQEFILVGMKNNLIKKVLNSNRNVFKELRKYNIEPLVTIHHFDTPIYLVEKYGDWQDRIYIDYFC